MANVIIYLDGATRVTFDLLGIIRLLWVLVAYYYWLLNLVFLIYTVWTQYVCIVFGRPYSLFFIILLIFYMFYLCLAQRNKFFIDLAKSISHFQFQTIYFILLLIELNKITFLLKFRKLIDWMKPFRFIMLKRSTLLTFPNKHFYKISLK